MLDPHWRTRYSLRWEDCSELGGSPGLGEGDCSDLGDLPGLRMGGCSAVGDSLRWEDCSELGGSPGLGVGDCSASAKKTHASDTPSLRPDASEVVAASRASCASRVQFQRPYSSHAS